MNTAEFLRKQLKGSSLIEVIVALIIISLIFSFGTLIYLNVQKSGINSHKLRCEMRLNELFSNTLKSKEFVPREFAYDDIVVYQEVTRHSTAVGVLIIILEARDADGKLLVERKHLVYAPVKP